MSAPAGTGASGTAAANELRRMSFGIISVLATLVVVVALSWRQLAVLGAAGIIRLALIWGVIIAALLLLVRMLGLGYDFT